MGLLISTKEIDSILSNSIQNKPDSEVIRIIPCRKQTRCPMHILIGDTISNSCDQEDNSSSELSVIKQEKADINEYPMNCLGKLIVSFSNNQLVESTCSLICSCKVLTLISNIYHPTAGKATTITLQHGTQVYYEVTDEILFPLYQEKQMTKYNFIILTFQDLSVKNWFGIQSPKIDSLFHKEVNVTGFIPEKEGLLYSGVGKIQKHYDSTIKYAIDCFEGQEGGPLFIISNSNFNSLDSDQHHNTGANIIGIHNQSLKEDKEGYGAIINEQVFDWIKQIVDEENKNNSTDNNYRIEKLDFSQKKYGPLEIKYLSFFQSDYLTEIDLTSNKIKAQGVYYLSYGHYPNLSKLYLNNNEIGDLGAQHLALAQFKNLTELRLANNYFTHKAVESLLESDFSKTLKLLDLSENPKIKDKGIKLFQKKNWDHIEELYLHFVGMTDEGIKAVRNMSKCLKTLVATGNKFTEAKKHIIASFKSININIIL